MTSGEGGLKPEDKNINLRQREALSSVKILGYERKNLIFAEFPF